MAQVITVTIVSTIVTLDCDAIIAEVEIAAPPVRVLSVY